MPRAKLTFDDARKIALRLPGVEERATRTSSSLKMRGKTFACPATNKSAEPNSMVVWIEPGERELRLTAEPDIYYVTDHYRRYSVVLVRLSKIDRKSLHALLKSAVTFVSATAKRPKPRGRLTRR